MTLTDKPRRALAGAQRAYHDGCEAAAAYLAGETDEYRCPYPREKAELRTLWLQGWLDTDDAE